MAKIKRGLGKGLGAIFEENTSHEEDGIITLKIVDIEPNSQQPRVDFNDGNLEELSASIVEHGVLSPLLVRPLPTGNYRLVAGERRWRAARLAGLTEVPVIIKTLSNEQSAQIALIENIQRENLNPIEEAFGYKSLMDEFNMTQQDVAKKISKSRSAIANSVRLLNLPEKILEYMRKGEISTGHGKVLLSLEKKEQIDLVDKILKDDLSVRETEKLAKNIKRAGKSKIQIKEKIKEDFLNDPFFKEVELSMNEQLGHKVVIKESKGRGTLEIHFNDKNELSDILGKLSPSDNWK